MRKLLGKLGEAITRPFLRACLLLLLFSPAISHTQTVTWYAGRSDNNFTFTGLGINPGCFTTFAVCQELASLTTSDGTNVPFEFQPVVVSLTELTGTVTIPASVPSEMATFTLELICDPDADMPCPGGDYGPPNYIIWQSSFPVQIVNCPVPKITAVSPSIWFADKTYDNVVIKGTGFVTPDKATASCPATTVTIAAADNTTVPVSNVSVVDKTKITVTVAPPTDIKTQSATITAGTAPNTGTYATTEVLGNPQIQCSGAGMQCNGTTISVIDGSPAPQNAVVGQHIMLATTPSFETLATLPVSLNFSQTTWMVKGTNIDSYSPTTASAPPPPPTVLSNPGLNTYWVYSQDGIPVTYKYCVDIPNVGNQCSNVANAIFNVTGPSATITPNPNSWGVTPPIACPEMMQFLYFGYPDPTSGCSHIPLVKGISFTATLSNLPDSSGTAEWVQLVTNNILKGTLLSGGSAGPTSLGTGLDNTYPYPPDDPNDAVTTSASDSPNNDLDPSLARETRRFAARMYYLWQPQIAGSIFVPLGYVDWSTSGTAKQSTKESPPWSLASSNPTSAAFHTSSDTGAAHGFPTWNGTVQNSQSNGSQNDDDEMEEQQ